MSSIRVMVWNEGQHEKKHEAVQKVYPQGIHGAIAEGLQEAGYAVQTATLDQPEHGLSEAALEQTDVLIWWAHIAHDQVDDAIVERVHKRVLGGMGLIVLHSGHFSKNLQAHYGFVIGNDMSSRDIEGENPLYLPQAKVYSAACSLGPCILLSDNLGLPETLIHLEIDRDGETLFSGETHTNRIHRTLQELTGYLGRSSSYPSGLVLLTGTGIVPPGEMSVIEGDIITIAIEGIGTLSNTVKVV